MRSRNSSTKVRSQSCRPSRWIAAISCVGLYVLPVESSHAATWRELGPAPIQDDVEMAGRIVAVATHPTDANILYAGAASGGLWRWENGQWTPLTDAMPVASIGSIALDPKDPETIYVGTGEPTYSSTSYYGLGIYKSTDGGATWAHYGEDLFGGRSVTQIAVSPATGEVFASVTVSGEAKEHPARLENGGLFRSTDGGVNWEPVAGFPAHDVSDFQFEPGNPQTIYAGVTSPVLADATPDAGLYRSDDGGKTWKQINKGFASEPEKIAIAVSPVDTKRVYVLAGGEMPSVYVSDDRGESWRSSQPSNFTAQIHGHYDLCAIADPEDVDTAYFGGVQMVRTTDGGESFARITPPHTDIQRLAFDAEGTLIVGQDGGVHVSSDQGRSWSTRNKGLGTVQIYAGGALNSSDPELMVGGLQDNGTVLRRGGLDWDSVMGADGGCNASHPDTPQVVFSEIYEAGNIYRSDDGGMTFDYAGEGIDGDDRTSFLPPFIYHPSDPDVLFYGTQRMWKTTNRGASWQAISEEVAGNGKAIRAIAASQDAQSIYVATTGEEVHVSHDGGASFTKVLSDIHGPRSLTKQLRVAPWDSQVAYLAVWSFVKDQVQMTTDGGKTWTSIKGNLPDVPANTVEVFRVGEREVLLAGTDRGVFATCDLDKHWRRVASGFPNTPVVDLQYDAANERVVGFTFGRGAWELEAADEAFWLELCEEVPDDTSSETTSDTSTMSSSSASESTSETSDDSESSTSETSESDTIDDTSTGTDTTATQSGEDSSSQASSSASSGDASDGADQQSTGCSCQSTGTGPLAWSTTTMLGLWAFGARRRRLRQLKAGVRVASMLALAVAASACTTSGKIDSRDADETSKPSARSGRQDASMTQHSDALHRGLKLSGPVENGRLRVLPGAPISMALDRPAFASETAAYRSPTWSDVELSRFVVQHASEQETVTEATHVTQETIDYRFPRPGTSVLLFCAHDKSESGQPQEYCNKTVVRVPDLDGKLVTSRGVVAGKSGEPVEIRAMMSPDRMRAGSVLPIRVYCDGNNPVGEEVVAIAPDGSQRAYDTAAKGVANIRLDQAGSWTIRYRGQSRGTFYMTDLVFETLGYQ